MSLVSPLQWPAGWPRAKRREPSRFQVTLAAARDDLYRELELMRARNMTISSNAALNLNGTISARQPFITDPGVAVYFTRKGQDLSIACDRWDTIGDNIRAVGLSVAALRGLERWGSSELVDAAFRGYAALPETTSGETWWAVLDVESTASADWIDEAFRVLAKRHHPDVPGGDREQFARIQDAYRQATTARRTP